MFQTEILGKIITISLKKIIRCTAFKYFTKGNYGVANYFYIIFLLSFFIIRLNFFKILISEVFYFLNSNLIPWFIEIVEV